MSSTKPSKKYKGFDVLSISKIPDCASKGIYLRHRKTGLEVFHLLNNDEENLFAFTFRTPPDDSTGAAHILEHSVLCGSENYPLKDTFIRLVNQSVKTYLNALTFPDKTVFPASSMVSTDYFNLMSVYGDAVFFPKLDPEIFQQEAHRLEIDKAGTCSIQGVVYNEMKGNYSSFDSVSGTAAVRSLFPGTVYAFESGGDPLAIPSITYEQLKAFHKKYYKSDNCLVFLYGNIPTKKQLDFLQEHFLDRIEKSMTGGQCVSPTDLDSILRRETVTPFANPVFIEEKGPAPDNREQGATVMVNWLLGDTSDIDHYMECIFLSEILCGHDGSPLQKALLESGLGEDIAPNTGLLSDLRSMMLTVGLRGVQEKNVKSVESLVFKVLNSVCENGIDRNDIDSAIMSVSFANREVIRSGGPYSIVLLLRALRSWTYGKNPAETLGLRSAFGRIKQKIETDSDYIVNLIRKLLLENKHRSLIAVVPDATYSKERNDLEQKLIADAAAQTTVPAIQKRMDDLHAFQEKKETPAEIACIPHISPKDLIIQADAIRTEISTCRTAGNEKISLFLNRENTNGIIYVDVAFPADVLPAEDYPYLPLFSIAATNTGWNGKSWAETAGCVGVTCGGFSAAPLTSSVAEKESSLYSGRDWILFRMKMLSEKSDAALDLFADCLSGTSYSDTKRLQDLANEFRNDFDEAVIPSGHEFAVSRAARTANRTKAVDEIWNGISQLFTAHRLAESSMRELGKRFAAIAAAIKNGGAVIHVTADETGIPDIQGRLPDFARKAGLHTLKPRTPVPLQNFYRLTELSAEKTASADCTEVCIVQSQVGFAAAAFPASPWGKKTAAAELVLSHWLTNTLLWEQLRTIGGAYGTVANVDPVEKLFTLITYRDPDPGTSLKIFTSCMKKAAATEFDSLSVERAITGTYSREIQPRSPAGRGFTGFLRCLYGITEAEREKKLKWILSVTGPDMTAAAGRLYEQSLTGSSAVICGKNTIPPGSRIILPV